MKHFAAITLAALAIISVSSARLDKKKVSTLLTIRGTVTESLKPSEQTPLKGVKVSFYKSTHENPYYSAAKVYDTLIASSSTDSTGSYSLNVIDSNFNQTFPDILRYHTSLEKEGYITRWEAFDNWPRDSILLYDVTLLPESAAGNIYGSVYLSCPGYLPTECSQACNSCAIVLHEPVYKYGRNNYFIPDNDGNYNISNFKYSYNIQTVLVGAERWWKKESIDIHYTSDPEVVKLHPYSKEKFDFYMLRKPNEKVKFGKDLTYTVFTDKETYRVGEQVSINYVITNRSKDTVRIENDLACPVYMKIKDSKGSTIYWDLPEGNCKQSYKSIVLQEGESEIFTINSSTFASAGSHSISLWLVDNEATSKISMELNIDGPTNLKHGITENNIRFSLQQKGIFLNLKKQQPVKFLAATLGGQIINQLNFKDTFKAGSHFFSLDGTGIKGVMIIRIIGSDFSWNKKVAVF